MAYRRLTQLLRLEANCFSFLLSLWLAQFTASATEILPKLTDCSKVVCVLV